MMNIQKPNFKPPSSIKAKEGWIKKKKKKGKKKKKKKNGFGGEIIGISLK